PARSLHGPARTRPRAFSVRGALRRSGTPWNRLTVAPVVLSISSKGADAGIQGPRSSLRRDLSWPVGGGLGGWRGAARHSWRVARRAAQGVGHSARGGSKGCGSVTTGDRSDGTVIVVSSRHLRP